MTGLGVGSATRGNYRAFGKPRFAPFDSRPLADFDSRALAQRREAARFALGRKFETRIGFMQRVFSAITTVRHRAAQEVVA